MKVSVIGTIMRDEIHTLRGERRESFGGILYNIVALASLTRSTDIIEPICCMGGDHLEHLKSRHFQLLQQIRLNGVVISPDGTDENILTYHTDSDRHEQMTIKTPNVSDEQIAAAADSEAVLINIINGREITFEQLTNLREECSGHIHLDIHNLGKEIDETGKLVPKGLPQWRDWFSKVDSVQANEWEVEMLTGAKPVTESESRKAALQLISSSNLKAAALTIGGRGCFMVHRLGNEPGKTYLIRIPAIDVSQVQDTTGCGDCFSSAFIVGLIRYQNPVKAALMATALSGLNTQGGGIETLSLRAKRLDKNAQLYFEDIWRRAAEGWCGDEVSQDEIDASVADLP